MAGMRNPASRSWNVSQSPAPPPVARSTSASASFRNRLADIAARSNRNRTGRVSVSVRTARRSLGARSQRYRGGVRGVSRRRTEADELIAVEPRYLPPTRSGRVAPIWGRRGVSVQLAVRRPKEMRSRNHAVNFPEIVDSCHHLRQLESSSPSGVLASSGTSHPTRSRTSSRCSSSGICSPSGRYLTVGR